VMDRGFRDAIITLESEAHQNVTHMPQLLAAKQKAFTAAQGNESRRVTLIRWVVEAVNGRIKRKFRLFRDVVPGGYLEKTGTFFKIACAIINRFSPPLSQNSPRNDRIAEKALELMAKENELEKRVTDEKLDRNTKTWRKASCEECVDFPVLSKEDLETITLGIYQVNLAKGYTKLHLNEESEFRILLNDEFAGIVRAKLESRFIQAKTHNVWIQYDSEEEGVEAISAYYCRCKNGSRTVGCCSHVCAVLWYLGFQRHQDPSTLRIRKRSLKIRDAKTELAAIPAEDSGSEEEDEQSDSEEED
jgi:hypothetical protein